MAFGRFVAGDWWLVMIGGLGCEVPGWWWFGRSVGSGLESRGWSLGCAWNASARHGIWLGPGHVRCSLGACAPGRHPLFLVACAQWASQAARLPGTQPGLGLARMARLRIQDQSAHARPEWNRNPLSAPTEQRQGIHRFCVHSRPGTRLGVFSPFLPLHPPANADLPARVPDLLGLHYKISPLALLLFPLTQQAHAARHGHGTPQHPVRGRPVLGQRRLESPHEPGQVSQLSSPLR